MGIFLAKPAEISLPQLLRLFSLKAGDTSVGFPDRIRQTKMKAASMPHSPIDFQ